MITPSSAEPNLSWELCSEVMPAHANPFRFEWYFHCWRERDHLHMESLQRRVTRSELDTKSILASCLLLPAASLARGTIAQISLHPMSKSCPTNAPCLQLRWTHSWESVQCRASQINARHSSYYMKLEQYYREPTIPSVKLQRLDGSCRQTQASNLVSASYYDSQPLAVAELLILSYTPMQAVVMYYWPSQCE